MEILNNLATFTKIYTITCDSNKAMFDFQLWPTSKVDCVNYSYCRINDTSFVKYCCNQLQYFGNKSAYDDIIRKLLIEITNFHF